MVHSPNVSAGDRWPSPRVERALAPRSLASASTQRIRPIVLSPSASSSTAAAAEAEEEAGPRRRPRPTLLLAVAEGFLLVAVIPVSVTGKPAVKVVAGVTLWFAARRHVPLLEVERASPRLVLGASLFLPAMSTLTCNLLRWLGICYGIG